MKNKSILLISENKSAGDFLSGKLLLLRNSDNVETADFETVKNTETKFNPDVIILDSAGKQDIIEEELSFLKKNYKDVYLILYAENIKIYSKCCRLVLGTVL